MSFFEKLWAKISYLFQKFRMALNNIMCRIGRTSTTRSQHHPTSVDWALLPIGVVQHASEWRWEATNQSYDVRQLDTADIAQSCETTFFSGHYLEQAIDQYEHVSPDVWSSFGRHIAVVGGRVHLGDLFEETRYAAAPFVLPNMEVVEDEDKWLVPLSYCAYRVNSELTLITSLIWKTT